jgi:uncharacterized protein
MKNRFAGIILLILFLLTGQARTARATITVPERTSDTTWVEDYAGVLSDSTESYIQNYSQKLADEHSACIMVVTVDFVTGTIEDYARAIFNQWQLGDAELNNGVLLLLSIGDDDYYMMIGRGLENSFPIADIQDLLDNYLEPYFADQEYDQGVRLVYEHTYSYLVDEIYGGTATDDTSARDRDIQEVMHSVADVVAILFFVGVVIVVFVMVLNMTGSGGGDDPGRSLYRPRYHSGIDPFFVYHSNPRSFDRGPSSGRSWSSHSSSGGSFPSSGGGSSHGGSSRGAGAGRH